jgi:hypothetical protein
MSQRLLEILAQAQLAPIELQRAQQQAQSSAANTAQWIGALQSLVPLAGQAVGAYQKSVAEDADTAAQSLIAQNKSSVGPEQQGPTQSGAPLYGDSVGDVASKAVDGSSDLAEPKPQGFLDSVGSLLGDEAGARAKARATALTGIANEVQGNREKADALARQNRLDAIAANNAATENALKTTQTELANTQIGDVKAQAAGRDLATKIAARKDAVQQVILGAPPGSTLADIDAAHPGEFTPEELGQGYDAIQKANAATKLNTDKVNSEIYRNYAEGNKANTPKPNATTAKAAETAQHLNNAADALDKLATIYESGNLTDGLTGSAADHLPPEAWDPDRVTAHQLASEAALTAPSVISGSTRLNETELKEAKHNIVGDVGAADSNDHKAQRARDLAAMFRKEAEAQAAGGNTVAGAMKGQPKVSSSATISVGPMITVRRKSDGQLGQMPASSFNSALYDRVQ